MARSAQVAAKPSTFLLETSPFKGLWGQTSIRAEHQLHRPLSAAYMIEKIETLGEHMDSKDQKLKIGAEVLWYLSSQSAQSFFVSLGFSGEREILGRKAQNPYHRFGSNSSQEKYTFWRQKSDYLSLHQSIGIRFYSTYYWTASFKFVADELIAHSNNIESIRGDLKTADNNLKVRAHTKFNMVLNVGLWIP
ncbi:MAG: hypothetical protein HRU09_09445 [Oligoflexales bacterium]|nr:hypothetical protein [Oligoflexales bacterium]